MKKKTVKIIAFLSLIILIINMFNPISFAVTEKTGNSGSKSDAIDEAMEEKLNNADAQAEEDAWEQAETGFGSAILDGIAGILFYPMKLIAIGLAQALRLITGTVAAIGGGGVNILDFSLDNIFFNEVPLVKLDFFNIQNETNPTLGVLKRNIAQWYYILRNISLVILLGILIYVGIRMAISTVASEEAKYKKMLENWIVSIILLFLLHYIIILILTVNNSLVEIFRVVRDSMIAGAKFNNTMEWLLDNCWSIMFTKSIGNTAVYVILVGVTLIFLLSYIKRMITVAFLIMISPLIVITYSIDKMGDGKSQALNTWLKEFSYNVLIQPFHCVIYLSLVSTAVKLMQDAPSLGSSVLSIVLVVFIWTAEDIVKKIFGFEASSLAKTVASAAVVSTALKNMKKGKSGGAKAAAGGTGGAGGGAAAGSGATGGAGAGLGKMPKMKNMLGGGAAGGSGAGSGTGGTGGGTGGSGAGAAPGSSGASKKPSKAAQTAARIGRGAQNLAGKYASASFKLAMAGFGAALGASTGEGKTALIGMEAGQNIGRKYGDKVRNLASHPITTTQQAYRGKRNPRILKSNQKTFASTYKNYKNQLPADVDNEKIKAMSKNLLNMSDENAEGLNPENMRYRDSLKAMKESYGAMGMNDKESSQAVLDTIEAVQNGSIRSSRRADKKLEKERMANENS